MISNTYHSGPWHGHCSGIQPGARARSLPVSGSASPGGGKMKTKTWIAVSSGLLLGLSLSNCLNNGFKRSLFERGTPNNPDVTTIIDQLPPADCVDPDGCDPVDPQQTPVGSAREDIYNQ